MLALVLLMPLKSVEPFVVRVDRSTGVIDVVPMYGGGAPLETAQCRRACRPRAHGAGTVIYAPSTSQDVLTGVLKDNLQIQPTVVKRNGDRIEVLVARDIDFRPVYELAATGR